MSCVLTVALIQTVQAMAFAPKQIDGIDDLDAIENRCPLTQPSQLFLLDSLHIGHEIDDAKRSKLQSQNPQLSIDRRGSPYQSAAFCPLDLSPSPGTHPNIAVF